MPHYYFKENRDDLIGHPGPEDSTFEVPCHGVRLAIRVHRSMAPRHLSQFSRRMLEWHVNPLSAYQIHSLMHVDFLKYYHIDASSLPRERRSIVWFKNGRLRESQYDMPVLSAEVKILARAALADGTISKERSNWHAATFCILNDQDLLLNLQQHYVSLGWEFIEEHFNLPIVCTEDLHGNALYRFTAKSDAFCEKPIESAAAVR